MRYVSTRGTASPLDFSDVLLRGLAPDGGLYVPERLPHPIDHAAWGEPTYAEVVARVAAPFVEGSIDRDELEAMAHDAYESFRHPEVAPLTPLGDGLWLLELYWGPTLSFKDYALQLVGRLFDHVLSRRGRRMTILAATSGDTGSAAIEACRDRPSLEVVVLFPEGRVSEVQQRQMTTVTSPNVHCVAVDGTFDDCQRLVKDLFADETVRNRHSLGAVNSINWARIMAQAAYYVWALLRLGTSRTGASFVIPTGNFGNLYAGHLARSLGAPIRELVAATNRNDVVARFLGGGEVTRRPVRATLSPAMDIQVPSNLERLLFEVYERQGDTLAAAMRVLSEEGELLVPGWAHNPLSSVISGDSRDDEQTIAAIEETYRLAGKIVDPHTAIGVDVARSRRMEAPVVSIATAHPAKFPGAVERAIGVRPALPDDLADLLERPERLVRLPNDAAALERLLDGEVAASG